MSSLTKLLAFYIDFLNSLFGIIIYILILGCRDVEVYGPYTNFTIKSWAKKKLD